jgi:hypothetical protein
MYHSAISEIFDEISASWQHRESGHFCALSLLIGHLRIEITQDVTIQTHNLNDIFLISLNLLRSRLKKLCQERPFRAKARYSATV